MWRISDARPGRVAAELDVGAAAGHVRGDRDGPRPPGLGDDARLLLVELGVERLVLDPSRFSIVESTSDFSTVTVPTRTGRPAAFISSISSISALNLAFSFLKTRSAWSSRTIGRWVGIATTSRLVDLVELLGLGHRRAGHAGELVVEPEVVLERDRGEGHRLALDPQALLRLDRLVEALAPAPARHLAAGELVDDDDLAVLDDVVAVALVQHLGLERLLEVAGEARVGVERLATPSSSSILSMPSSVGRDGLVLEVDEEVAALLRRPRAAP